MNREALAVILMSTTLFTGCSSRPRTFQPELSAAPADQFAYERILAECREHASGDGNHSGSKIAAGAGTAAAGGAVAGSASWGAAAVAGAATVIALPIAGLVWGLKRGERGRDERRIQSATEQCLEAEGYQVDRWTRMHKGRPAPDTSVQGELEPVSSAQ